MHLAHSRSQHMPRMQQIRTARAAAAAFGCGDMDVSGVGVVVAAVAVAAAVAGSAAAARSGASSESREGEQARDSVYGLAPVNTHTRNPFAFFLAAATAYLC